jgi:hypothetical protein
VIHVFLQLGSIGLFGAKLAFLLHLTPLTFTLLIPVVAYTLSSTKLEIRAK